MHIALQTVSHRPWPLTPGPWIMAQTWHDLLFMHWPVAPSAMRGLVPAQLELDLWEGQAWVAVVPFWMSGVRARGTPAVPRLSCFPELNVRTYVRYGDKPGVYFFSLDAASLSAVQAARAWYHLPYFLARMSSVASADAIEYASVRRHGEAEFRGVSRPLRDVELRKKGSIEHWLTERYCLFTEYRSSIYVAEIHHPPWPLQDAAAEVEVNTMASAAGITLPPDAPLLHFARRIEVVIWPIKRAARV
jgi:uncharacterized protein YqjF (DUF2071 family)